MSLGLSRICDQLGLEFRDLPWNGVSPRYLTRAVLKRKMQKPRGKDEISDAELEGLGQLRLRLEGGSYGS